MKTDKNRLFLYTTIILSCTTIVFAILYFSNKQLQSGNFSDEMKLEYTFYYDDEGANEVERDGDHIDSPYFAQIDFYNEKPTETLSILPKFKTIQQTSWWSCGVSSVEMVLAYYDCLGEWNEESLANLREDHSDLHDGTCLDQIIDILQGSCNLTLETSYDHLDEEIDGAWIKEQIENGYPIIVGWIDWAGHWQVIIGYDDMGTEDYYGDDVIIVADPFDTTDHNQDGYGIYGMERFLFNFDFYNFFPEDHIHSQCFVVVKP